MASHIGVPQIEYIHRPTLHRSRSHSSPSQNAATSEQPQAATDRPKRPTHGRSQSYLSPVEAKPRNASTLPTPTATLEKASSRLHLPGKHHLHHESHRKHRYTQSEIEQQHRLRKHADTDSLPHLVAGLNAERGKRAVAAANQGSEKHASNDVLSAVPAGLTRMMSSRSYRGQTTSGAGDSSYSDGGRYDLHRRATSDPRQPMRSPQQRVKNPIEQDLERADRMRRQRRFTLTKTDVAKKDKEIEEAEEEMRGSITDINRAGMEITRRLDYGYYNLLEKVGNLVSTIQSFHSLAQQSQQLVVNFEHEADRLDKDTKRRVGNFKAGFEEREERVERLGKRGREVNRKAEELGRRLENARVMVENWEKREEKAKQVWWRFWGSVFWTLVSVLIVILGLVMWKEYPVKAGLNVPSSGNWNRSLSLGEGERGQEVLGQVNLPEDVKAILEGIEDRNRQRKQFVSPIHDLDDPTIPQDGATDRLHALDEL